jgi:dephospho-CoA kinase
VFRTELAEDFLLVAIHTDPDERHDRLTTRGRDDDADSVEGHRARDDRELNWGIARTIAMADEMLVNAGELADFHAATARLLDKVEAADTLQPKL